MNILFLVKTANEYGTYMSKPKAGLYNSAKQIVDMINTKTKSLAILETSIDGNDVDSKLAKHKPNVCVIEAIWITPTKMRELIKLYPKVVFIIRIHSKIPFLAMEGTAIQWIKEYHNIDNVFISFNNKDTSNDMRTIGIDNIYLPNVYNNIKSDIGFFELLFSLFNIEKFNKPYYNIGCFGAIRPMKNHLNQAVAAIKFCEKYNASCIFYVNAGRIEQNGENVLKNLRALFMGTKHILIELGWLDHDQFLRKINDMDICLQVSLTESFNIVSADCVSMEIPIVTSKDIDWLKSTNVDPNNVKDIVNAMEYQYKFRSFSTKMNLHYLNQYNKTATNVWINFLND